MSSCRLHVARLDVSNSGSDAAGVPPRRRQHRHAPDRAERADPGRGANRILKRSFEIIGSAFLIVVLSPLLLGVAAAIKLTGEGPVFFRQDRVGLNGEVFRMIKFRSMQVDDEARLDKLRDEQRDAGNVVLFKLRNDPRVTPIGRFLRRFSLDELPQLFNVARGSPRCHRSRGDRPFAAG